MIAIYPNLDLSRVVIDDTVPLTPSDPDAASDEADESVHTIEDEVKEPEAEAVDQPAPKGQTIPDNLATPMDPSSLDGTSSKDQSTPKAPPF